MKIKQLLATFSVGAALTAIGADEMTRIIGYNVLIGFNRAERIEETASWLREKKPDVVLFQEIARQTDESFARQAKLWNHSYAAVCKGIPHTTIRSASWTSCVGTCCPARRHRRTLRAFHAVDPIWPWGRHHLPGIGLMWIWITGAYRRWYRCPDSPLHRCRIAAKRHKTLPAGRSRG